MTDINQDILRLTNLQNYLSSINSAAGNLSSAATALASLVPATDLVNGSNVQQIQDAYKAIFSTPQGTPIDWNVSITATLGDLKDMNQQITTLTQQVATLQQQLKAAQALAPVPVIKTHTNPTQPQAMSTTVFIAGVATLLAIGGGIWWAGRQAKTKAIEGTAARKRKTNE